ncbi:MAG TPA: aryl-sulfate sulfotransferase [Candidatus Solibacter sp.]|nr:aryl-sulfate sulfotransferase [Candidatus Solibacter sp.]
MSKIRLLEFRSLALCVLPLLLFVAGCSSNYSAPQTPAVTIAPNPVTFTAISQGATSAPTMVVVTNSGNAALAISSVAFGGSNTADFTNSNSCSGSIAPMGTCNISVTFAPAHSGSLSETITITDNASSSPQVINVSGTANPIAITLTPPASAIGVAQSLQFTATGDPNGVSFSLAASLNSGPGALAPPGTIDSTGLYTPPPGSPSLIVTVTATSKTDPTKSAFASVNVVAPGAFSPTNNVQVAQYSVNTAAPANVSVQFGLDTNYGLNTWTVPTGQFGGLLSTPLYVAGMKQSTPYHMRGVIQFADGTSFNDADFTFTTGALPAGTAPNITATTTVGMTPQPGVELLDLINFGASTGLSPLAATDLAGNVIWTYSPVLSAGVFADPIKLQPNGNFVINFNGGPTDGANSMMQEVDLGGNVIWQMTGAQLNTALAAATCAECNVTVIGTHHDFVILPNGHLIVIASTQPPGLPVVGDVIIDLGDMENVGGNNPAHTPQPVWAWNEFNHLDLNRRPFSQSDWTHTNAILYSKDDGNLIISIRHQNWLVKIDYANGAGAGDILWKLGAVLPTDTTMQDTANFALLNADGTPDTNLHDWFFAQHGPSFTTSNTTGNFGLTLFDNGNDRAVVDGAGGGCGAGQTVACYSTVPIFNIDETAMTAQFLIHPNAEDYSFFGGNAQVLQNNNLEYAEASNGSLAVGSGTILEVTQSSTPQTIWKMVIAGQYAYRGMRIGSLYPGVQW